MILDIVEGVLDKRAADTTDYFFIFKKIGKNAGLSFFVRGL